MERVQSHLCGRLSDGLSGQSATHFPGINHKLVKLRLNLS
jgi:hypothetical protein